MRDLNSKMTLMQIICALAEEKAAASPPGRQPEHHSLLTCSSRATEGGKLWLASKRGGE